MLNKSSQTICFLAGTALLASSALIALNDVAHAQRTGDVTEEIQSIKPASAGESRSVTLGLDKSLVVELPIDVRDVLVSNPQIADAIVRTARKIFLIGNRVGQTNVFMFDEDGNTILNVNLAVERDLGPLRRLIDQNVPNSNVKVEIISDNVVLTGTVPNPIAARRVADLAQAFLTGGEATTGQFTNTGASGLSGGAGDSFTFSTIDNPDDDRQVSQVINLLQIEGEDQVHLKVVVAEVQRSVLKQLGLSFSNVDPNGQSFDFVRDFSALATGVGQGGGLTGAFSTNNGANGFTSTIRALERANVLRTLAEPTLTAQSGRQASFLAGGEVFIPTEIDADDGAVPTIELDPQEIGVSLTFTPIVQSSERISLTLDTEVSSLDPSEGLTGFGPPSPAGSPNLFGISVRRASSTIELPSGGTMIVGGLLQDEIRKASEGIPYLRNLPILGPLFGSAAFTRNETELVILATPYLVRPIAASNATRPDKNFETTDSRGTYLFNQINRIYGGKGNVNGTYHGRVGFIYD